MVWYGTVWYISVKLALGKLRQENLEFKTGSQKREKKKPKEQKQARRQRQADLSEFKACLVYVMSSRLVRVTQ